jgi:hypothetical protein
MPATIASRHAEGSRGHAALRKTVAAPNTAMLST